MSFTFRQFHIDDSRCGMKVGTDSTVLGAWTDIGGVCRALDIGTGCGILALMTAQRAPQAIVTAVEIDPGAAADAAQNFAASPWADRLRLIETDITTAPLAEKSFDLIVCNPPFFTEKLHAPSHARATARHEGALGVESLIALAQRFLAPGGSVAFVAPTQRDSDIDFRLALAGFCRGRLLRMRQRDDRPEVRTFRQVWREPGKTVSEQLTVNNPDGTRTDQYQSLTNEFYL